MNGIFQIERQGKRVDIYLYGNITAYPWKSGDRSSATLVDEIKQLDAEEIHLHINSLGGSVPEGWAMYSALTQHSAKVTTYADGFVASAALYPYLAGDTRIASSVSAFYMHEAGTYASGYADDLRKAADQVELITDVGINAFVERTGQSKERIAQLMKEETWLTPEEAMKMGLATTIQRAESAAGYTQSVMDSVVQAMKAAKQQAKEPAPHDNLFKKFFV